MIKKNCHSERSVIAVKNLSLRALTKQSVLNYHCEKGVPIKSGQLAKQSRFLLFCFTLTLHFTLLSCCLYAEYVITTIAGTGVAGYSGDNVDATSSAINDPFGVAVDDSGNIYIADEGNNRIRKVDASGTTTTVAGTGVGGYSCDGGPATSAQLNHPIGVAVDDSGNIYIADEGNNRIRKITCNNAPIPDGGTDIKNAYAYPSPLYLSKNQQLKFANIPPNAEVSIFTINGMSVKKQFAGSDGNVPCWDGKDEKTGDYVGTGTYIVYVKSNNSQKVFRIVVFR
ncbi:MAG: hypothetical protein V1833_01840 [Elusimicrobiota bacterium]